MVFSRPSRELGIELVKLNGRVAEPVKRVELASDPLRPPFISKQVQSNRHRQCVVVQDRVQLAAPLLVGRIVACPRKQVSEAEESPYQGSAAWCQEAQAFSSPRAPNDRLGFILKNHRLRGDPAHSSPRVTRRAGRPGQDLARPSTLLNCRSRRRPAASKAAHVLTISPPTTGRSVITPRYLEDTPLIDVVAFTSRVGQGYGCGATITRSAVVDKMTKAMQSSAPIATASAETPPILAGTSGG